MAVEPTLISSVQRALHLLDTVGAANRPLPAKALARRAGLPLPTAYHLLRTLVHEGYLTRVDGGYVLGDHVTALSSGSGRVAAHASRYRQVLTELHHEVDGAAYLSVLEDDGRIVLAEIVDSAAHPRVDLWVGFDEAAHATALGKAVLASMDEGARRDYVGSHDLPDLTPNTVTDRRHLIRQLDEVAEYTLDREEYALGTACIAVPVPSPSLVAAVAVSIPARQLPRVLERADALRRASRLIAWSSAG
jgi:IclR family acetate operon transcriptional repressor